MNEPADVATPLSLKALLDEAFRLVRRHARALYLPFALPLALMAGAVPLIQLALAPPWEQLGNPGAQLRNVAISFALAIGAMLAYSVVYSAIIIAATDILAQRPLALTRAWLRALDPRLIGTLALVWIITLVGIVLCILPGIYVGLVMSVVVPIAAHEGRYGVAALRRSVALMQHNPRREASSDPRLRAFLLFLAGGLIGYACGFLVQLPLTAVMMFMMVGGAMSGQAPDPELMMRKMMWLQVPANMISMLVQTVVFLYMAFGIALLYFDVCRRKEGGDLLAAADVLARRDSLEMR